MHEEKAAHGGGDLRRARRLLLFLICQEVARGKDAAGCSIEAHRSAQCNDTAGWRNAGARQRSRRRGGALPASIRARGAHGGAARGAHMSLTGCVQCQLSADGRLMSWQLNCSSRAASRSPGPFVTTAQPQRPSRPRAPQPGWRAEQPRWFRAARERPVPRRLGRFCDARRLKCGARPPARQRRCARPSWPLRWPAQLQ